MAITASDNEHIDLSITQARQGFRGRHALIILIVSFALTALAFLLAYAVNHRGLSSVNNAPTASAAEAQASGDTQLRPAQQ